ncbi:hypothetical protein D3C84_1049510 [compost metagenome]
MLFQSADGAHSRTLGPSLALGRIPLTGQVLEGIVGSLLFRGLPGALGGHRVLALGCVPLQLGCLLAGLHAGQLVTALTVATKPQP